MTVDMFVTKEQQLEAWAKAKGYFSKAEVMEYGLSNYYLRAERTVRDMVSSGRLRRLSAKECTFRGLKGKMAWYCWEGCNG